MKKFFLLSIFALYTPIHVKPFNVSLSQEKINTSVKSIKDFSKFDSQLLDIIERYKNAVLIQAEKREEFLQENKNNPDLIDFINFLISEGIIQPNSSIELGKIEKNSWCNHPALIDQLTAFFKTGILPLGDDTHDLQALHDQILAFITEGPLQTRSKTVELPNFTSVLENIKRYQRALVCKLKEKIFQPSKVVVATRNAEPIPQGTFCREAKMFSTAMAFFYLWAENPYDKAAESDFIKYANVYYREYPQHFEKVKNYLREKIKTTVAVKLNTLDTKKILSESSRIEKRITKKGWWQFWK